MLAASNNMPRPRRFASGGASQVTALSFVPTPTSADAANQAAGTADTPVSYTSSSPATAPNLGPVIAQINNQGIPQMTPSAQLPDSAGRMVNMDDPGTFQNPLNTMPSSTASSVPPSSAVSSSSSTPPVLYGGPKGVSPNGIQELTQLPNGDYSYNGQTLTPAGVQLYTMGTSYSPGSIASGNGYYNPYTAPAKRGGKINKLAIGGIPTSEAMDPWYTRAEERTMMQPEGLIRSMGAGRTDIHQINVPSGSYVLPADVVSGVGEGNTLAGAAVTDRMMHSLPFGIQGGGGRRGSGPPRAMTARPYQEPSDNLNALQEPVKKGGVIRRAEGGGAQQPRLGRGEPVPIIIAGGEFLIHPGTIIKKYGNLQRGHQILDKFVVKARKEIAQKMLKLPPPKK